MNALFTMAALPSLTDIWKIVSKAFTTLDVTVAAPAGITGGVLSAIGVAYCIVKTFEGATEASRGVGAPILTLLYEFYRLSRKALIVAALVAVSVPTAAAFRNLAKSQVKGAMIAISETFGSAAGLYQSGIGSLAGTISSSPVIAASRMNYLNVFMSGDQLTRGAMESMAYSKDLGQAIAAINTIQRRNANLPGKFKAQGQAANAQITAQGVSAAEALKEVGKATARYEALKAASAKESVQSLTSGNPITMLKGAVGATTDLTMAPFAEIAKYITATLLGFMVYGIALIGLVAGAIALLKEGVGVLSYLVGVSIAVSIGGALAMAFAPAFMMCFLSDRTEPYGRSFVQFLFSMAFSAMAVGMATKVAGGLVMGTIGTVMSKALPAVQDLLSMNGDANLFYSAAFVAVCAVFAGMTVSFFTEVIRRGASIGAGFFAGSFSA